MNIVARAVVVAFVGGAVVARGDVEEELALASDAVTSFEDTHQLTDIWGMISRADNDALINLVVGGGRQALHSRAGDRRGPLWWAFEFQNVFALAVLKSEGVDIESTEEDVKGLTAQDMCSDAGCEAAGLVRDASMLLVSVKTKIEHEQEKRADARRSAEVAADAGMDEDDDEPFDEDDKDDF